MKQFRAELPRVYELRDCIKDPESPEVNFQSFDEKLAISHVRDVYLRSELALQELDGAAWESLKKEAIPYLKKQDKKRAGWEQLFAILNQARAYRYLKSIGCTELRFIRRCNEQRTPDLEGELASDHVLCEVKTINPSAEEIVLRNNPPTVRSLPIELTPGFLRKLRATIEQARQQLCAYDPDRTAVHFVYLNISFDDFFAEQKDRYFQQIDNWLRETPISGIRLVLCNDYTAFYSPLQMLNASVDNIG
ncbi:MAG TPA: hypothetical protein VGS02_03200 [Acidobacteriaceae bacterium]|nr:hypothetical protein [Acidobacteriaceae bacterium]